MSHDRGGASLPPLTPLSLRIQFHAAHMGVARLPDLSIDRPIHLELLDIVHELPLQLTEENLLAPRTTEGRPMERPQALENMLGVCTPQFFLRNTARTTRDDEKNQLEFQVVESIGRPVDPAAIIREAMGPSEPLPPTVQEEVRSYLAQRAEIMLLPWNSHYGRPDPG